MAKALDLDPKDFITAWETKYTLADVVVSLGYDGEDQKTKSRISNFAARLRKAGVPLSEKTGARAARFDFEELKMFHATLMNGE